MHRPDEIGHYHVERVQSHTILVEDSCPLITVATDLASTAMWDDRKTWNTFWERKVTSTWHEELGGAQNNVQGEYVTERAIRHLAKKTQTKYVFVCEGYSTKRSAFHSAKRVFINTFSTIRNRSSFIQRQTIIHNEYNADTCAAVRKKIGSILGNDGFSWRETYVY